MKNRPDEYSPLVLAYIGDAVYELYTREMLVSRGNMPVDRLHKEATGYVRASAQSESFKEIESVLTEKEIEIFKRGRNTKSTVPKNADMSDYRTATGLEALIGYIYLTGDKNRLDEIMSLILNRRE
ncbi:MAG: Mini-ribonuclease 3 [Firmicutes bacterium ADurb.Bin193]|nr:MAG: Mini-ribonuclease 3 [Firmicutes bacterium ADurb.Bin193]